MGSDLVGDAGLHGGLPDFCFDPFKLGDGGIPLAAVGCVFATLDDHAATPLLVVGDGFVAGVLIPGDGACGFKEIGL